MSTVCPRRDGKPAGRLKPYRLRTCSAAEATRSKSTSVVPAFAKTFLRRNGIWIGSATASETRASRGKSDEASIITRKKTRKSGAERREGDALGVGERAGECCVSTQRREGRVFEGDGKGEDQGKALVSRRDGAG